MTLRRRFRLFILFLSLSVLMVSKVHSLDLNLQCGPNFVQTFQTMGQKLENWGQEHYLQTKIKIFTLEEKKLAAEGEYFAHFDDKKINVIDSAYKIDRISGHFIKYRTETTCPNQTLIWCFDNLVEIERHKCQPISKRQIKKSVKRHNKNAQRYLPKPKF